MNNPTWSDNEIRSFAAEIHANVLAAVAGDSPSTVSLRTGLGAQRVKAILAGELPDSFEVMTLETRYGRPIWPSHFGDTAARPRA